MNNGTFGLKSLAIVALAASGICAWASEPPAANIIFKDPAVAEMANGLARGNPNAASIGHAKGANLNARGFAGVRPIHYVVEFAHDQSLSSLKALIEAGADTNAADDLGRTPAGIAAARRGPSALRILTSGKAALDAPSQGKLPIQIAFEHDAKDNFEFLISGGSPIVSPLFKTGSLAGDLADASKFDLLSWMAHRNLIAASRMPLAFWSTICSSQHPFAAGIAANLSRQPGAMGCKK